MANPQKENGYVPIANELFEKIGEFDFLGSEFRVIICVLRKTYGFNKKEDYISLTQFELATKLSRPTIVSVLKNLVENNVLIRKGSVWKINKDWESWNKDEEFTRIKKHRISMFPTSKAGLTSKHGLTSNGKAGFTDTSKAGLTHKRQLNTKDISIKNKTMQTYTPIDESGNPLKRKSKTKINQEANRELIEVSFLWQSLCSKFLQIPKEDVIMYRIYFPIRATYDREHFTKEQFKELFEYFFKDRDIKQESKLSFDLCLSQKYIGKFKLKNKQKVVTNVSLSDENRL